MRLIQRASLVLALATPCAAQDLFTPVPQSVIQEIGQILPEQSNAGAAYVSEIYSPNLVIGEPANVQVIFVWEGAGYRNSLGYFTFQEEADGSVSVLSSNLLIPDASFPSVGTAASGDTYDLLGVDGLPRTFQPGERIGFFVVADGWNREPLIQSWDPSATIIPSPDATVNGGFGRGCYTSIDKLNPEYALGAFDAARHLALIWFPGETGFLGGEPFLVAGFEDLRRTENSDEDFNDLVFIATSNPIQALAETPAFPFEPGDPDGDGVMGSDDHYPQDGSRALVTRYPTHGEVVVGFEDQYPFLGDADYNDVVLAYHFETVYDASGLVRDILLTAHLVARGAGYDHGVGIHVPGIPEATTGSVRIERILSDDAGTVESSDRTLAQVIQEGRRVPDIFPSTRSALPPLFGGTFTNTQNATIDRPSASARVHFQFDTAVDPLLLGSQPYDLYFNIYQGEEAYDVHFPGFEGFEDRPASLPEESGPESFIDEQGFPWMLEIPTDWQFPLERVRIWNAYPDFNGWVGSQGGVLADWYRRPTTLPDRVGFELVDYIPVRSWTVDLPTP